MSNLVKKTKITELKNKIPDVSSLVTKIAWTAVENKLPGVSNVVKKRDYHTKVTEIENKLNNHNHDKYVDTPEFNKLAEDAFMQDWHKPVWQQKQILMLNYRE